MRFVVEPGTGNLIPAGEYYARKQAEQHATANYFMPDIAEFRSPLNGKAIGSRSALREHERAFGVRQCGELKTISDFDNKVHKPFSPVLERMMERHGVHRRG